MGLRAVGGAVIIVVAALMLGGGTAHADTREDAKRAFADGQAAEKKRDHLVAIEHYLRAYELVPHPFALYNVGFNYEQLGRFREAAHYYKIYIEAPDSTDRPRIQKLLDELKLKPSRVLIRSTPEGARVMIDGKVGGMTPFAAQLKGGTHKLVADKDDQRDQKTITLEFGEPLEVMLSVERDTGTLFVNAYPPGAEVRVDGVVVGVSPVQVSLKVGFVHRVHISQNGFSPFDTTATVAPGMINEIRPRLTNALATLRDPEYPSVIKINYLLGIGAGVDVTSADLGYTVEFGLRGKQFELVGALGKLGGNGSFELLLRYALTKGKLAPILGAGYSYLGANSGAGYEGIAGIRYEVLQNAKVGMGLLAHFALRYSLGSMTDPEMTTEARTVLPLNLTLQIYYR